MSRQMPRAGKRRRRCRIVIGLAWVLLSLFCLPAARAAEKWSGVDATVVEKYAQEQGREAREPLINTNRGDLLLFVFLLAGAVGGFAAGYYWRVLLEHKDKGPSKKMGSEQDR